MSLKNLTLFSAALFGASAYGEICIETDRTKMACFPDQVTAKAYAEDLDHWEADTYKTTGRVNKDNPSSSELLSAAIDAVSGMHIEGSITVEIITPSGYTFRVTMTGRKDHRPPMIQKPDM